MLHPQVAHRPFDDHIAALGAAAGKKYFSGRGIQILGHYLTALLDSCLCFTAKSVNRRWVAEMLRQVGHHFVQHVLIQRCGSGVIEVNFHFLSLKCAALKNAHNTKVLCKDSRIVDSFGIQFKLGCCAVFTSEFEILTFNYIFTSTNHPYEENRTLFGSVNACNLFFKLPQVLHLP